MARDLKVEEHRTFTPKEAKLQIRTLKFNGTPKFDIRRYYEKDGELRPGKGASLGLEEFQNLRTLINENAGEIEEFLSPRQRETVVAQGEGDMHPGSPEDTPF